MSTTTPPPAAVAPAAVPTSAPSAAPAPPPVAAAAPVSVVGDALKPAATEPTDAKVEGAKPADAKATEGAPPAALELKLPEGMKADEAELSSFKTLAAELKLDTPAAQKLFDFDVARQQARAAAAEKAFTEQDAGWRAAVEADPELGGAKFQGTVNDVRGGLKFLGGDLGKLLSDVGLGNHPAVVRALVKIGRANKDDTISGAAGGEPGGKPKAKSDAEIF